MLSVKYHWINVPSMLLNCSLVQTCCKCSCRCKVFGRRNNKVHFVAEMQLVRIHTVYTKKKTDMHDIQRVRIHTLMYACEYKQSNYKSGPFQCHKGKCSYLDVQYGKQLFGKKQQLQHPVSDPLTLLTSGPVFCMCVCIVCMCMWQRWWESSPTKTQTDKDKTVHLPLCSSNIPSDQCLTIITAISLFKFSMLLHCRLQTFTVN